MLYKNFKLASITLLGPNLLQVRIILITDYKRPPKMSDVDDIIKYRNQFLLSISENPFSDVNCVYYLCVIKSCTYIDNIRWKRSDCAGNERWQQILIQKNSPAIFEKKNILIF